MSTVWLGYIFAIVSSVFSALYVVPKKLSRQKPITYAMVMGIGFFIASAVGFAVLKVFHIINEPLFFPQVYLACLNGVVWTVASVAVLSSIDRIGLAKSNQWKSLQGPIGALLMMTFLFEFLTTKVIYILLAIALITLAALMFSTRDSSGAAVDKKGVAMALIAALFYGISALLGKYLTGVGALFAQQIYQSLFVVISSSAYLLIKYKRIELQGSHIKREAALPLIGGLLFFCNNSFSVLAYRYLEGSIVLMLHQLNAIWLFLLGVFLFKEIDFRKHWLRLMVGIILSIAGVLMLVLAKV